MAAKRAEFISEQRRKRGLEPLESEAAAEIGSRLAVYWNAFWTLHSSRQAGLGGAMPIHISEIKAYCDLCGFDDPIIRYDLMTMVQAMDEEWLKIHDEDSKSRERASARASPSRR